MVECLHPVDAWKCGSITARDGVRSVNLVFSPNVAESYFRAHYASAWKMMMDKSYMPQKCGKCSACQIRKRKDMSTRLSNEASVYRDSCFITLTYNEDNLPYTNFRPMLETKKADLGDPNELVQNKPIVRGKDVSTWNQELQPTLLPRDITLFLKRLRMHLARHCDGLKVRYFVVGEYGSKTSRPHYHLIVFGWMPKDVKVHQVCKGYTVFRSATLEKLWPFGFSTIGTVNAGVAKYCARYVTKKLGDLCTPKQLSCATRCPVFTRQSTRNGGMGAPFFDRWCQHILRVGYVTYRSGTRITKAKIPRTYISRARKYHLPEWLEWRDRAIQYHETAVEKPDAYDDLVRACAQDAAVRRARESDEVF